MLNWFGMVAGIFARLPIERWLIKPRDTNKSLEALADRLRSAERQNKASISAKTTVTTPTNPQKETIATACVPCAVGHISTSAGLLKEAVRFKGEGITSNEVLNRVAMALEEQNALERGDLTPEKIQSLPPWERELAEEALLQSRQLRHNLENLQSIEQLEQLGADSERVYKKLFREWFKQRFAHLGPGKAQRIADEVGKLSPEDKERVLKSPEELEVKV